MAPQLVSACVQGPSSRLPWAEQATIFWAPTAWLLFYSLSVVKVKGLCFPGGTPAPSVAHPAAGVPRSLPDRLTPGATAPVLPLLLSPVFVRTQAWGPAEEEKGQMLVRTPFHRKGQRGPRDQLPSSSQRWQDVEKEKPPLQGHYAKSLGLPGTLEESKP